MSDDVRKDFKELKLLDLQKCKTVSDIVKGMNLCSFGARMLGEVSDTLTQWASSENKAVIIFDGKPDTSPGKLLQEMVGKKWFSKILTPEEYAQSEPAGGNILVVGLFSGRVADKIFEKPSRAIYINEQGITKPGQVKDGFYPDVSFADPKLILPIINLVLEERLNGKVSTAEDLMKELSEYGDTATEVANGAQTLLAMVQDPDCTVFMTLSGAMTIAKMGLIVCDMIDYGMVQYISSTGALMAHGFIESVGLHHYKYNPKHDDKLLADQAINRVTDTLEPEENFTHIDEVLEEILSKVDADKPLSPSIFHKMLGKYLHDKYPNERGILKSAFEKNVPVLVPAFVDSEIGNDVFVHNLSRKQQGLKPLTMDMEIDTQVLVDLAKGAKRMGIFTIGGGVPRNNTQNVAPLIEIANDRLDLNWPQQAFYYGCKIAPDKMFYGHLSGCTYSEGMSWRKMDPKGRFSEIHTDATIVWPFLVKFVMEKLA